MDMLLDSSGDLYISPNGDIVLENSVTQKIRIRLLWFKSEWRWDVDEGLPYMENLLIKNPDIDIFESLVRAKIFEVDEVTEVKDVGICYDRQTRRAVIRYTACTDYVVIKEEVELNVGLRSNG